MNDIAQSSAITGKTVRFAWKDGPTKGKAYDHVFHRDGTVEWHDADKQESRKGGNGTDAERVKFADEKISDGVRLISYLSKSGFTLTVVLNYESGRITGIASNEKTWMPVHGSFKVVE